MAFLNSTGSKRTERGVDGFLASCRKSQMFHLDLGTKSAAKPCSTCICEMTTVESKKMFPKIQSQVKSQISNFNSLTHFYSLENLLVSTFWFRLLFCLFCLFYTSSLPLLKSEPDSRLSNKEDLDTHSAPGFASVRTVNNRIIKSKIGMQPPTNIRIRSWLIKGSTLS